MEKKTLTTRDGIPLNYYRAGDADDAIVIVNAPGMSIKFWASVIKALSDGFTIIAFEYRGYPENQRELSAEEILIDNLVDDMSLLLEREGVEKFNLASWCLGAKLGFEYYRRFPEKVLSLIPISIAYDTLGEGPNGPFSQAILDVQKRIKSDPTSARSMITMMRRIGVVPDADFFTTIFQEKEDAPTLGLIDMLEKESSMSNLAFYMIDDPIGLKNYLNLYEEFRKVDIVRGFKDVKVPVVVVGGDADKITPIDDRARVDLKPIESLKFEVLERASHFILLEFPNKVAKIIREAAVTRRHDQRQACSSSG